MSARKPLAEGCTGGVLCPVEGHVRTGEGRWSRRYYHVPLTQGQSRTLYERRMAERDAERAAAAAEWIPTSERLPESGVVVETKLDTPDSGVRNVGKLKRDGSLWYVPDGVMYVYYRPTHWRPVEAGS